MGVSVEAINESTKTKNKEMIDDFVSIVTSFCNRIYEEVEKRILLRL